MTIVNATNARKRLYKLIEEVRETHEPVYITGKTGNVVMLSDDDYRSIQETLYLVSVPTMREKIIEGLNTPLEECLEDSDGE
jgi:antitoxin YefM